MWKTAVYHFSVSYLVLELQSFEDAKIKAKSMDTKHAILVMSHTLNKYSMDSKTTIQISKFTNQNQLKPCKQKANEILKITVIKFLLSWEHSGSQSPFNDFTKKGLEATIILQ